MDLAKLLQDCGEKCLVNASKKTCGLHVKHSNYDHIFVPKVLSLWNGNQEVLSKLPPILLDIFADFYCFAVLFSTI